MRAGQASHTAEHNALFRAVESARPAAVRIVHDPLARQFLRSSYRAVAAAAALPVLRDAIPRFIDGRWPGVRPSVIARTKVIDGLVADAAAGRHQLVLLGAGYDTRAYRLPGLRGSVVFEVDHPDTQAAKRRALAGCSTVADEVRHVGLDFTDGDLGAALAASGWSPTEPATVVWEGVTNYLTAEAVDATLRWCGGCAPGSLVVFTYVHVDVLLDPSRFAGTDRLFATLARAGEQLTFGLHPAEVGEYLQARNLVLDRDVGAAEYRRTVYGPRADRMRGHEFYRLVAAHVA